MPQPPEVAQEAARLADVYRRAQERLEADLRAALSQPTRRAQQARLRALARTVGAYRAELEAATRGWLAGAPGAPGSIAAVHALGAQGAAASLGSSFAWTAPHAEAVQALAGRTWADVAEKLQGMEGATRRALRDLAREASEQVLLSGRTAAGAGRDLAAWMGEQGVGTVTYANGARHLAADWADTVARTVTATAYNSGTFTQLAGDGVEWVEVSDGPDCGWGSHNDPDKANGTVRPLEDALTHSISHPRCVMPWTSVDLYGGLVEAVRARYSGPCYTVTASAAGGAGTNQVAVGPHHPMLTGRGWVPAHLLREGDDLFYDAGPEDAFDGGLELDLHQVPSAENCFEAAVAVGVHFAVPAAGDDLHGDAVFCQGEIQVVRLPHGLLGVAHAGGIEHAREVGLMGSDVQLQAPLDDGVLVGLGWGVPAATGRDVGGGGDAVDLEESGLGVHALPSVALGLGDRSGEPCIAQDLADRGSRAPDLGAHLVAGHAFYDVEADHGGIVQPGAQAFDVAVAGVGARRWLAREFVAAGLAGVAGGRLAPDLLRAEVGAEPAGALDGERFAAELARSHRPGHRILRVSVTSIEVGRHDGWVYDFTTSAGAFAASRIVVRNCARSFAGRPDVATPAQAEAARRFEPDEQARLAEEERARDRAANTTLAGRARNTVATRAAREGRVARAARTPRTPRA